MSSRYDSRRRERSRDRGDDRSRPHESLPPRRRYSRSRSPRRDRGRDRRPADRDRRDTGRDRGDDRRDRERRGDDRRRDERDRKDDRDDRRREPYRDRGDRDKDKDPGRAVDRAQEREPMKDLRSHEKPPPKADGSSSSLAKHGDVASGPQSSADYDSRQQTPAAADGVEEGEEMEVTNEDDEAMMAMMGMSGFGTTKGKHVEGNQEGAVDVKKMRTWRQYMNRRGGFNRPLDKIK